MWVCVTACVHVYVCLSVCLSVCLFVCLHLEPVLGHIGRLTSLYASHCPPHTIARVWGGGCACSLMCLSSPGAGRLSPFPRTCTHTPHLTISRARAHTPQQQQAYESFQKTCPALGAGWLDKFDGPHPYAFQKGRVAGQPV